MLGLISTLLIIALLGYVANKKKEKVFLIFLLLLITCCGKIAANYGVTEKGT
jgi:hypothetical protein